MRLFVTVVALLVLSMGEQVGADDLVRYVIGFLEGLPDHIEDFLEDLVSTLDQNFSFESLFDIPEFDFSVVKLPFDLADIVAKLPVVNFVEEDVQVFLEPPRIDFSSTNLTTILQSLDNEEVIPYGIQLVGADLVDDRNAGNRKICIVDSGYDLGHPDLPSSTVTGSDDIGAGEWLIDGNGHGTHVAGTIAAIGGNSKGVMGVIRNGQIGLHIVRIFDAQGQNWASDLIAQVQKCVDNQANVVSMSLGRTEGGPREFERESYEKFLDDGILVVAASGNHGDSDYSWPASYDAVVSVAALDRNKNIAGFSGYNNQVELAAPGVSILSTFPGNQYATFDGTSMATPHVSGAAALVWSSFPQLSAKEIRAVLRETAEDLGDSGRDEDYGFGLVRADLAYGFLADGNQIGTDVPSTPPPTSTADCVDNPLGWVDSGGDGCDWYDHLFRCRTHGDRYRDPLYGKVAVEACCVCDGGMPGNCQDDPPGWVDSDGDGCDWYAVGGRCAEFGEGYENDGKTAMEACCACQSVIPASTGLQKVNATDPASHTEPGEVSPPTDAPSSSPEQFLLVPLLVVAGSLTAFAF